MKKIVSILLAAVLALGMTAAVLAVDYEQSGSTEVFTVVPSPSYTLVIPASVEIPYGSTDTMIAEPTIADVQGFKEQDSVDMNVEWTNLICAETKSEIEMNLLFDWYRWGELYREHEDVRRFGQRIYYIVEGKNVESGKYFASITEDAWENAAPGRYTATVTFHATYNMGVTDPIQ